MAVSHASSQSSNHTTITQHPLDPLSAEEITQAAAILRQSGVVSEEIYFCSMALHEPPKEAVQQVGNNGPVDREARVLLYDRGNAQGVDVIVSLTHHKVRAYEVVSDGQVHLSSAELVRAQNLVKADPDWQAAMRRRGLNESDFELIQVDTWVTGGFEPEAPAGHRLLRGISYRRTHPADNGYARPIEGVIAYIDLTGDRILGVDDDGIVPLPPEHGNYSPDVVGPLRTDLRPIEITQPEGTSFEIDGHDIRWQKWRFRISMHPIQGLVLHTVSYEDEGRVRSILHRAALSEMVVPYGDPGPAHHWKNVFDAGEVGLGRMANSLTLGCDCLGEIHYVDVTYCDAEGNPVTIPQAICLHEEDYGILWKHTDARSQTSEVRRSRRMVVSSIHTVGNYEYGLFWYFYLDGSLQMEIKLTGIVQTSAVAPGDEPECLPLVAPQLAAPNHQHLFNVRLDFDLDGVNNSVYEVDVEPLPRERNPHGNAFAARPTLLAHEAMAQRDTDPARNRYWMVVNPNVHNALGQPVGYKLTPGSAPRLIASDDSSVAQRAGFTRHNLWVTAYDPAEQHAAGDYPNQHPGGAGLPAYVTQDRPLENRDIVMWYSFGVTHIPRPEDWPVMPVEYTGFLLQPVGFFNRNPALDVPPSAHHCENG
ncbi:primary-amine oxidase [Candidatus Entotheonella palauensis]|uniref:primary-amine oxidase n=1 Tax=Candidatus Entotheonella palauensis TaxID=93172 RepID=UPI000B7CD0B9|nr:primary-amine oxidase [Candidatus Entotheonella palauensis]